MGFALRLAMQVDARIDRFGAARETLLLPAVERLQPRRGIWRGAHDHRMRPR